MKENFGKPESQTGTGVEMGMNDTIKKELEKKYSNVYQSSTAEIKLPKDIKFIEKDGKIEMILNEEAIGKGDKNRNMQEDIAAFEGWAVILKRYLEKDIKLDIAAKLEFKELKDQFEGNGHFKRFLYRVLRFREQYEWFSLSESLERIIFAEGGFHDWLKANGENFINNVPLKEKTVQNNGKISENWVEGMMAGKESILHKVIENGSSEGNEIFRQLPVGLFSDKKVKAENEVFARGNAAVDLWTWDGDKFYAFELKYRNKMVGIITEIFFYANFMYDLLIGKNFTLNKKNTEKRGYQNLLNKKDKFKEICAFMLVDEMHPLIDEKVLEILNNNKSTDDIKITYEMRKYKMENMGVELD